MKKYEETIELLKKYNQEHIIKLLNSLEENKQEELIQQLTNIDLEMLMKLYENTKNKVIKTENKIEHISYLEKANLDKQEKEKFDKLGEKVIINGEYAVVTMAGRTRNKIRLFRTKRNF